MICRGDPLRELDTLGRLGAISDKGDNFVTSCLLYCTPSPL